MSENSDGGGGSQISALDDLLAGGIAGSASVIVGRELDFFCAIKIIISVIFLHLNQNLHQSNLLVLFASPPLYRSI